jgi:transposase
MTQLHKRLSVEQISAILDQYKAGQMKSREARLKLGLGKTRFFSLLKRYEKEGKNFKATADTEHARNKISEDAEKHILEELKEEKKLITNKSITINHYNYSAVRDVLKDKHKVIVSVPTIISRAKENGFYLERPERKVHDRVVCTDFIGELVQHDSSHHLWSPYMKEKLYLITSLDDCSRLLLFADLFEEETSWAHISALQSAITQYGCPLNYYADQHAIFRYVKDRDTESNWKSYSKFTDDVDPQWKQVLKTCGTEVIYALSPQAKGKIERPYRWLQDRIVRTAAKENLTTISELKEVLRKLKDDYNNVWVHSTTGEIPSARFEKQLNSKLCLFRPLQSILPDVDMKDIFCLRWRRRTDGYRKVSLDSITFDLPEALPYHDVEIHITPDWKTGTAIFRFWQEKKFVGERRVKISSLKMVRF